MTVPPKKLGALLIEAGEKIAKVRDTTLKKANLNHLSHGRVLVLTVLADGPATQADICRYVGQKPPSMMEMLQRLEKSHLVKKEKHPESNRKVLWSLTTKGKKDWEKAQGLLFKMTQVVDATLTKGGYPPKKVEEMKAFLSFIIAQLDARS
ncbi:winged helix DNA-binding protein [bacterium]|nr:winged helix DNA-binding protein [bacterium]